MADALGKATETVGGLTKTATDTAGGLTKTATDTAGGLTKTATDTVGQAAGAAGGAAGAASGAAGGLTKRKKRRELDGPYGPGELVGGTGSPGIKQNGPYRIVPVKQSRIADRPPGYTTADSNIKIKIELDLEVEVEIYARVKGDVTIGLM